MKRFLHNMWRYLIENNVLEGVRLSLFGGSHRDVVRYLKSQEQK